MPYKDPKVKKAKHKEYSAKHYLKNQKETKIRNKETKLVDVYIDKIRFSEQGREGWVSFTFDTMTRQYNFSSCSEPELSNNYEPFEKQIQKDFYKNIEVSELEEPPF